MRAKVRVGGRKGESINSPDTDIYNKNRTLLPREGGWENLKHPSILYPQENITLKCFLFLQNTSINISLGKFPNFSIHSYSLVNFPLENCLEVFVTISRAREDSNIWTEYSG